MSSDDDTNIFSLLPASRPDGTCPFVLRRGDRIVHGWVAEVAVLFSMVDPRAALAYRRPDGATAVRLEAVPPIDAEGGLTPTADMPDMPDIFPCGCARAKVAANRCAHYSTNGSRSSVPGLCHNASPSGEGVAGEAGEALYHRYLNAFGRATALRTSGAGEAAWFFGDKPLHSGSAREAYANQLGVRHGSDEGMGEPTTLAAFLAELDDAFAPPSAEP